LEVTVPDSLAVVELCESGRFVSVFGDRAIEYGSGFRPRAELA
jgi:hypothetical protein